MSTLNLKDVKLTDAEKKKLSERMSNWDKLHADLKQNPPSLETLSKMIKVEVTGKKRLVLATRLLGIYNGVARRQNEKTLRKALGV